MRAQTTIIYYGYLHEDREVADDVTAWAKSNYSPAAALEVALERAGLRGTREAYRLLDAIRPSLLEPNRMFFVGVKKGDVL